MGIGEIIDGSFQVMKRHFATLVRVVAIIVIPTQLLTILINLSAQADRQVVTTDFNGNPLINGSQLRVILGAAFAVAVISFLAQRIVGGAIADVVASDYLQTPVDGTTSLRYALKRIVPLLVAGILSFLGIVSDTAFCLIPGSSLRRADRGHARLVVEQIGPVRSLGRSYELVKSRSVADVRLHDPPRIMTAIPTSMVTIPVGFVFRSDTTANIIVSGIATD